MSLYAKIPCAENNLKYYLWLQKPRYPNKIGPLLQKVYFKNGCSGLILLLDLIQLTTPPKLNFERSSAVITL